MGNYKIKALRVITGGKKPAGLIIVEGRGWSVNLKMTAESDNDEAAQKVMNTLLAQCDAIQYEEDSNGKEQACSAGIGD